MHSVRWTDRHFCASVTWNHIKFPHHAMRNGESSFSKQTIIGSLKLKPVNTITPLCTQQDNTEKEFYHVIVCNYKSSFFSSSSYSRSWYILKLWSQDLRTRFSITGRRLTYVYKVKRYLFCFFRSDQNVCVSHMVVIKIDHRRSWSVNPR